MTPSISVVEGDSWTTKDWSMPFRPTMDRPTMDRETMDRETAWHCSNEKREYITYFSTTWISPFDQSSGRILLSCRHFIRNDFSLNVVYDRTHQALVKPKRYLIANESWLSQVNKLATMGSVDSALDILYDKVDFLLREGKLSKVDEILESANPETLNINIILGLLTTTLPAKTRLKVRGTFYETVEAYVNEQFDDTAGILIGLK